jgi:hypothetical protein
VRLVSTPKTTADILMCLYQNPCFNPQEYNLAPASTLMWHFNRPRVSILSIVYFWFGRTSATRVEPNPNLIIKDEVEPNSNYFSKNEVEPNRAQSEFLNINPNCTEIEPAKSGSIRSLWYKSQSAFQTWSESYFSLLFLFRKNS